MEPERRWPPSLSEGILGKEEKENIHTYKEEELRLLPVVGARWDPALFFLCFVPSLPSPPFFYLSYCPHLVKPCLDRAREKAQRLMGQGRSRQ